MRPLGIYIHWPYCKAICPYCDYNRYLSEDIDDAQWREAYLSALRYYAENSDSREVTSIFFGGGTPSLMPVSLMNDIISEIRTLWPVSVTADITMEANPTSAEVSKFKDMRAAGINRMSLGVQSLNDQALAFLGRQHNAKQGIKAFEDAQQIFDRASFDLMYARPDQSLEDWKNELDQALSLSPSHLSCYQLTIEKSTPFHKLQKLGAFMMPGDQESEALFRFTHDYLSEKGLPGYEVSSFSKAGFESKQNLIYWHYDDYIGIGPGAHGRFHHDSQKYASRDEVRPERWLKTIQAQSHGAHPFEVLSPEDQLVEGLMLGLRMTDGFSINSLEGKTGGDFWSVIDQNHWQIAIQEGLLDQQGDHIRLTKNGSLKLNMVIDYLLSDDLLSRNSAKTA